MGVDAQPPSKSSRGQIFIKNYSSINDSEWFCKAAPRKFISVGNMVEQYKIGWSLPFGIKITAT